ncbi:fungal-specific transcription factor domain-containing protein [Aspergillus pseudonomiae]|nr:fungal-specific transcription factor domain-containing protein [Aspergillus pseudonomiae]
MDTPSSFGILSDFHYTPCSMSSSGRPLSRRACNECRRKKTRCDSRHPKCSLCANTGSTCTYRKQQQRKRVRRLSPAASSSSVDILESADSGLNTRPGLFGLEGFDALDDLDTILCDLKSIDDQPRGSPQAMAAFGSFGAAPRLKSMLQECFPTPVERSPMEFGTETDNYDNLSISSDLADELIDLYFEKVQGICPLFMREKFDEDYRPRGTCRDERYCRLSPVAMFVLNGMFALSARYSSSDRFAGLDPHCRDQQFVKQAMDLWEFIQKDWGHLVRNLQCLQGLILLAFNFLQSGPSETAWNLTGTCVRLAYDLDLHTMDADKIDSEAINWQDGFQHRWAFLEEKRRAWWMVWEMDTFSSAISSRPYGIDSRVVRVLLPVSDKDWTNKSQARSVSLGSASEMPWQGIMGSSNQCERAWFLVCLAVVRRTTDTILSGASVQELQKAEDTISCAFLALPSPFYDLPLSKAIWQSDVVKYNWMACSLIALNWARSRINFELHEKLRMASAVQYQVHGHKPARSVCMLSFDILCGSRTGSRPCSRGLRAKFEGSIILSVWRTYQLGFVQRWEALGYRKGAFGGYRIL